jgi:hypothetical protein
MGTNGRLEKRLRNDFPLYCRAVLRIRQKNSELVPLELNDAQKIVYEKISKQWKTEGRVRAIILKARQEGVSTLTAARFFRKMHLWQGVKAMVVADSLERAGVLYDIYDRYLQNVPPDIAPFRKSVSQRRRLSFEHDSELSVRPATDTEAGRAQTIHLVHASEIAFWGSSGVDAAETWTSLMQAVPAQGSEVIVESTAKGAGGLFHDMWEQAENGENGWLAIFLPWWIHDEYQFVCSEEMRGTIEDHMDDFEKQALTEGIQFEGKQHILSYDQLAWRRMIIVENFGGDRERLGKDATRKFMQEYPATAEEAFLVSGSCFFDEDVLRLMARIAGEPKQRGRLSLENDMIRFIPFNRGFVQVYEMPDTEGHYVIGADTAEGKLVAGRGGADERGGRDYSAAVVFDTSRKKVVAEIHGRIAPEVFAEQLRLLGNFYACGGGKTGFTRQAALIGVERSHSSGQTVLRLLREHYHYPRLFWKREFNRLTRKQGRTLGWVTSAETRLPMLDDVAMLVRQNALDAPSRHLVRELVTFVVWPDGKPAAEEGCHDDRVIALGIAVQMAREHRHTTDSPITTWEPGEDQTGY